MGGGPRGGWWGLWFWVAFVGRRCYRIQWVLGVEVQPAQRSLTNWPAVGDRFRAMEIHHSWGLGPSCLGGSVRRDTGSALGLGACRLEQCSWGSSHSPLFPNGVYGACIGPAGVAGDSWPRGR